MFGIKNYRRRKREHRERVGNLVDMIQRASKVLKGWKDGDLLIEVPGTNLLEPSSIELTHGWAFKAKLFHLIDGTKVRIGAEWVNVGFGENSHTEDDPKIRRLLDLAYDYVWAKILLAEKEKKLADERYARLREEAIVNMIAHDDAQPKPLAGGGLTAV